MNPETETTELPQELIEGLKRIDTSIAVMTPAVDRRVREAAAAHFAERPHRVARPPRRWAITGTLAASLMAGLLLVRMQGDVEQGLLANDFDGSGTVDILDAFALARMDGDLGDATQNEIDALIMQVVSLNGAAP